MMQAVNLRRKMQQFSIHRLLEQFIACCPDKCARDILRSHTALEAKLDPFSQVSTPN